MNFLNTGPNRSELVARLLQEQQAKKPQIQSVGEGFARLGTDLVNALVQKKGLDKREAQEGEVKDALAAALMGDKSGLATLTGANPELGLQLMGRQDQSAARAENNAFRKQTLGLQEQGLGLEKERLDQNNVFRQNQLKQQQGLADQRMQAEAARRAEDLVFKDEQARIAREKLEQDKLTASPDFQADVQKAKADAKFESDRPKRISQLSSSINDIGDTRKLISELIKNPGREMATGATSILPTFPGSDASDFEAKIGTLKARLTFNELRKLKEGGGTLGAISEKELSALESAQQSLTLSQSEEQFLENLKQIDEGLVRMGGGLSEQISLEKLPTGSIAIGNGRYKLPDGKVVEPE